MEDVYNYMIWGNYNQRMEELAEMTIPEQWSFTGHDDNAILKIISSCSCPCDLI